MSMKARNEDTFKDLMAVLEEDVEAGSNSPPQAASL